ncbi:MAG: DUF3078 domain-containing protein [Bacteroidales bacterium]|nr:DUF3078 domain-containing protein [Bacteroidales bacterium]
MKKHIIFILGLCLVFQFMNAQLTEAEEKLRTQSADSIEGWKKGGTFFLNFAQTSLTNWAAGGNNSVAINGLASLFGNYKKGKSVWDNSLDIGYGFLKQGKEGIVKTDDKFDFLSKYGRHAFKSWYYSALLNFRTQLTNGYIYNDPPKEDSVISALLAPAYLLGAIGLDYKPNDIFSAFIAPLTMKVTFVNDQVLADAGAFGVDPGQKTRGEFGGYIRLAFKKDLVKNINFATKIDFFSNYLDDPQNIDINWEALLAMKITKYIAASLSTQLIYDDDIGIIEDPDSDTPEQVFSKIQFKEILGIGFTVKF